jgi:uncharacterized protein YbcI
MDAVPERNPENEKPGHPTAAISREVVKTLKQDFGRGPTRSRTYLHDDCVLVLLREGHTASERTMEQGGRERAVAQERVDISEDGRATLMAIVERTIGRKVLGFMSSSQQDPELISFVFVLEASPLLEDDPRTDEAEGRGAPEGSRLP